MTDYRTEARDQKRVDWDVLFPIDDGVVLRVRQLGPPAPHPWQLRGLRPRLLGETGLVVNVGEPDAC